MMTLLRQWLLRKLDCGERDAAESELFDVKRRLDLASKERDLLNRQFGWAVSKLIQARVFLSHRQAVEAYYAPPRPQGRCCPRQPTGGFGV
jgi:hypothetical protein